MSAGTRLEGNVDTEPRPNTRYDAFDGLRGTLALLFLALHASLAYVKTPLGELWPFKDPSAQVGFDVFAVWIHLFRLPLFFILAGFFARRIHDQRGPLGFVANRWRRIALPLAGAWLVVTPLTLAAFPFAARGVSWDSLRLAVAEVLQGRGPIPLQWFHLWFLFDLLVYYAAALVAIRAFRALPGRARNALGAAAGAWMRSAWLPVALAAVSAGTFFPMRSGLLETPGTFHRPLPTLFADAVFFGFGWLLFGLRGILPGLASRAWLYAVLGLTLFPVYLISLVRLSAGDARYHLAATLLLSLCTWLLVLGFLGFFLRYYSSPHRAGRYLADASYWCYLVHLPLVVWLPLFLAGIPAPAVAKFALVFAITTGACLLSYQILVRRTPLGAALSGARAAVSGRMTASDRRSAGALTTLEDP